MQKILTIIGIYLIPQIIFSFIGLENNRAYALILSTIILWMSEYLSLAYTSLMIPLLASVLGIFSFKEALSNFSHPILFLFIACFFLSISFRKSGLDHRISLFILKTDFFSKTTGRLLISVSLLSWVLSMWISNTAACAILIPILIGLSNDSSVGLSEKVLKKLLISCAYAASMGGLATPVGSPQNLLALDTLSKNGVDISFMKWMSIGLPISLIMLVLLIVILNIIFKEENQEIDCLIFNKKYSSLGKISFEEKITFLSFCICVFFWIFPGALQTVGLTAHKLSLAEAGLIGTLPLFTLLASDHRPLLDWKEVQRELDWGIIFLFAGGLTLGFIMDKTGVAGTLAGLVFNDQSNIVILGIIVTLFGVILSELGSNTASAALILPLIASLNTSAEFSNNVIFLTLCATFGASFGFMLPVSTPPNALAFSTGKLKVSDLMKAGVLFDILGLFVITGFLYIII